MINNNNKANGLINQLESQKRGLIEARINETNLSDRGLIIKQIELVDHQLAKFRTAALSGAN